MLGWSGGTFITLETFAFVFNLVLLSPMGGAYDEYGLRNFGFTVDVFQILLSLLFLGCMAGYCVVIILYILKLREDDAGSEYTYGEFEDAGTIPAPPVATNLSRSSTAHSNYSVHHNSKLSNSQLTQTGSQGILNQCNSQYHTGSNSQNHQGSAGKSPLLQDRRLKATQPNPERVSDATTGSYILPHHQKYQPYSSHNTGVDIYATYAQQHRGISTSTAGGIPYRQSQTLPHPHHYHRNLPTVAESNEGGLVYASTQFPSRMDLATLTQTITRNDDMKRAILAATGRSGDPRINPAIRAKTPIPIVDSNFEGDTWEQPKVQALKYSYGGGRKGGNTAGIQV